MQFELAARQRDDEDDVFVGGDVPVHAAATLADVHLCTTKRCDDAAGRKLEPLSQLVG